jgi:hypothetical protein
MNDGPTPERLAKTDGDFVIVGRSRSQRRLTLYDDTLGRAWMRHRVSAQEYSALQRYAYHWAAGGLLSPLQSVDLDRVYASNPDSMSRLARTAAQAEHRNKFHHARAQIGARPALVADGAALYNFPILEIGALLGYRSAAHGRSKAYEILSDAGYRLSQVWRELDR